MAEVKRYWFRAKRYGWGWGLPNTWQGWVVLALYLGALSALLIRVPPSASLGAYLLFFMLLTLAFVAICWLKGEPPRWRWGGK